MDPHPSQQHAGPQHVVVQPQQEVTGPEAETRKVLRRCREASLTMAAVQLNGRGRYFTDCRCGFESFAPCYKAIRCS